MKVTAYTRQGLIIITIIIIFAEMAKPAGMSKQEDLEEGGGKRDMEGYRSGSQMPDLGLGAHFGGREGKR